MKYCSRVYDYLYIDNYEGNLCICPWMEPMNAKIGNILTDNIEDVYNSDYSNYLRSTIEDQSFKHCRNEACPFLQNEDLEDVTQEEYDKRKKEKYAPEIINLAYDFVCNQYCETCRKTVFQPPKGYEKKMKDFHEKLLPILNTARNISASGHGDPFASKYIMDLLSSIKPQNPNFEILLETNGVFFDEEHWAKIEHLANYRLEVVITINSFNE